MPETTALKPCPFCGGDGRIVEGDGNFYATCNGVDCFCSVGEGHDRSAMPEHIFTSVADACAAWNRRAEDDL